VNLIDATGLEVLARLIDAFRRDGVQSHLVGAKLDVDKRLRLVFGNRDDIHFHRTERDAIDSMARYAPEADATSPESGACASR